MTSTTNATIDPSTLVHCGSKHQFHSNIYKTLDLLRLFDSDGDPVYFVIESGAVITTTEDLQRLKEHFYSEGDCPINYIRIAAIMTQCDDDPHGCFDFVRSVWMPQTYKPKGDNNALIHELFPEIKSCINA